MKRTNRYGIKSLRKDFPTDRACLEFIFDALHTRECSCGGEFVLREGRRQYQCSKCRFHIAPTASTLFHKSDTPLTLWFGAILAFSNAKSGISAKELERQLEVTYKTAWRMLHLIRKALKQEGKLSGDVEMDTAYFCVFAEQPIQRQGAVRFVARHLIADRKSIRNSFLFIQAMLTRTYVRR